jgi:hypothetical protein
MRSRDYEEMFAESLNAGIARHRQGGPAGALSTSTFTGGTPTIS